MEREILFRGRCCDSGSWHEGMPVRASEPPYRICAIDIPEKRTCVQIDPETCGQYTGLTDRNGRRIFEGDIVKHKDKIYEIRYFTPQARFFAILPNGIFNPAVFLNCEVIGNIHDDSELMKGDTND